VPVNGISDSTSALVPWIVVVSNHPFRPLRHRSVLLIWGAGVVSDAGTWIQLVVVGSLVAANTGSALQTGLIALATFMPQGIAAPVGGLLADRFDRSRVFVGGLAGQALFTTVLAVLLGVGVRTPIALAALIMCASAMGSIGAPAYSAMLPDLVPPEELMAMSSLGIYSWNAGRIVGPLLGTVLARSAGPAWTVAINAATFASLALAVLALRRKFMPHDTEPGSIRVRLVEGWMTARSVRSCVFGIAAVTVLNLFVGPFMGLIPAYVHEVFHGGVGLVGTFSSLQGIGAILGTLLVTALSPRYGRSRIMVVVAAVLVTSYLSYAFAPTAAFAAASVIGLGACTASTFTTMMYIVQRDAPHAQRGRVMSILQALVGFSYGIGILWLGMVGDAAGLRVAFAISASMVGLMTVLLARRLPDWRHSIDHGSSRPVVSATTG
jgi:MFS family permease